jgi:hypothetical protein
MIAGGDNRRAKQPVCRDANEQEDRDHDRRNEVSHRFPCESEPDRRMGVRSQHGVEDRRPKAKAGEHHHRLKISVVLRTRLPSTRRGCLLACR